MNPHILPPVYVDFWSSWEFDPLVLTGIALAAALYGRGVLQIWRRSGRASPVTRWRVTAYYAGLLVALLALVSPIGALGAMSFASHMAQHMLLTMVAAPLLLLGAPFLPFLWSLPETVRWTAGALFTRGSPFRGAFARLTHPLVAFTIHTVTIYGWHIPQMYEASLVSELAHYLQHGLFLGTALLFWWPLIPPALGRPTLTGGLALIYLVAGMTVQGKVLGAMFTFAGSAIYPFYAQVYRLWGLSVVADQQIAGLIMMVGGFTILLLVMTVVFFKWAAVAERGENEARRESQEASE